ncbi:MAG: 1-acyl-sn-glycerol-3-phosphate acyltransferase [Tidjanibacter sp.]|nr:1-acyl-sn-glycerol-3-phosphate acyltransferase [Tidjanibacter sp.]
MHQNTKENTEQPKQLDDRTPLQEGVRRLDMSKKPRRVSWWLRPVMWIASFPVTWLHRTRIRKVGMEGVKRPYLLLCNHNAFYDFMVAVKATFPNHAYYIVAIDGFVGIGGLLHWLMARVGCIPKRKFTNDTRLVRQLREVKERRKIVAFYPEARYSLCGTNAILPPSLGKLVKLLKLPVVTLITQGNHINSPFWHTGDRLIKTEATMKQILTVEQIEKMDYNQIMEVIDREFYYDDFAWQRDNQIRMTKRTRAEGLHKVLYQCPHCGKEYRMRSEGTQLWCDVCGHRWEMNEYGQLEALEGETHFCHIPDWYEWERENVRREVEAGTYSVDVEADVRALPHPKKFLELGEARFVHNLDGFMLKGKFDGLDYSLSIPASQRYSIHIEYDYRRWKRDCVDLSTLTDTMFVFPRGEEFSVTKISLATEEMYKYLKAQGKAEQVG